MLVYVFLQIWDDYLMLSVCNLYFDTVIKVVVIREGLQVTLGYEQLEHFLSILSCKIKF